MAARRVRAYRLFAGTWLTPDQLGSLLDDVDEPRQAQRVGTSRSKWKMPALTPEQVERAREILTSLDLTPAALARRADPVRALAEAVALVRYGRSQEGRQAVVRATAGEPARKEP